MKLKIIEIKQFKKSTKRMEDVTQTFQVRIAEKTRTHPFFGEGSSFGYVIDGIQGKTLKLTVGNTYSFDIDTPGHPFYFTTSEIGGSDAPGSLMGSLSPMDKGKLIFTVPEGFPSSSFYQCAIHKLMGGKVRLIDQFIQTENLEHGLSRIDNEIIMLPTLPLAEERLSSNLG